jgi:hypothetical protein
MRDPERYQYELNLRDIAEVRRRKIRHTGPSSSSKSQR